MNDVKLELIQKWMQSVVSTQGTMDQKLGLAEHFFHLNADEVVVSTEKLSAVRRLGIYADGYYARLLECLSADFPALKKFMGEEAFHAFAHAYLLKYPSTSYTLYNLGENFASFLAETRPQGQISDPEMDAMFDFPADLASLERARAELSRANCPERNDHNDFDFLSTPLLGYDKVISQSPCIRLLHLRFPLVEFVLASDNDEEFVLPPVSDSYVAVSRWNYRVIMTNLLSWQWNFLQACREPVSIYEAATIAAEKSKSPVGDILGDLTLWLGEATEKGMVVFED